MASRAIGKRAGALDGQLFLIKQLLILREQIAPFEAEFAVTEKDLDFSHMRSHMRRILGGQASIFSLSADNAMLQLVGRGPRIIESQVCPFRRLLTLFDGLHAQYPLLHTLYRTLVLQDQRVNIPYSGSPFCDRLMDMGSKRPCRTYPPTLTSIL